jgi:hypothetical protein
MNRHKRLLLMLIVPFSLKIEKITKEDVDGQSTETLE